MEVGRCHYPDCPWLAIEEARTSHRFDTNQSRPLNSSLLQYRASYISYTPRRIT